METGEGAGSLQTTQEQKLQRLAENQRRRQEESIARAAKRRRRKLVASVVAIVVILLGVYIAGVMQFSDRFMSRTSLGSADISDKTTSEVQAILDDSVASYSLTINDFGLETTIQAADISFSYDPNCTAKALIAKRNPLIWPYELLFARDLATSLIVSYDEQALSALLQTAIDEHNQHAEPAKEESIAFNSETDRFEYIGPVVGTQLILEPVLAKVKEALAGSKSSLELTEDCVVQPIAGGREEQLTTAAKQANMLCDQYHITFTLGSSASFIVDSAQAAQWISIGEDYSVSLDQTKIDAWIDSICNLLDAKGGERTYTRPDGKVVTVAGGSYGWATDRGTAAQLIRDAIAKKGTQTVAIPCTTTGNGFLGMPGADWGKRYIDVDISEQYARFYDVDGNLIWETDVITGTRWTNFETPTGVNTIQYKASPMSLRSTGDYIVYNDDGTTTVEEDYEFGRDVEYWMPFINDFIGLHDAWWQDAFGGNLYEDASHGSGGCINLPTDKAAELYDLVQAGDVVVTHW